LAAIDLSERGLSALAQTTGYRRGPLEKAVRLVGLLEAIAQDEYLRERVVLKGGTALNLFLAEPARLSIDADLDYIGSVERAGMLKERPEVVSTLLKLGASLGYQGAVRREPYALSELRFRYASTTGSDEFLKVDLNFLERVPILGRVEWKRCSLGIPGERVGVACLPANEVAGQKLGTLCARGAPRDLFDVARFATMALDAAVVRKVALFNGFLASLDLSAFDPSLAKRISQRDLDDKVSPLLLNREVASREVLLKRAAAWTDRLLPLDAGERTFAADLLKGSFVPEGLFGETEVNPRLREHPGLILRMRGPEPPAGH
jgi:predicted nucleotidyltransferase component of viral defense system